MGEITDFEEFKSKVLSALDFLTPKQKAVAESFLCPQMDFDRVFGVLQTITKSNLGSDAVLGFLCYQRFKVDAEGGEALSEKLTAEQKKLYSAFKDIRDISQLTISEEADDIRNLFIALSKDMRVVIMKLAGILYDIQKLTLPLDEKGLALVRQVKEIHVPLAERLGLDSIKLALDDTVIKLEHPVEFAALKGELERNFEKNQQQLELTKSNLESALKNLGIEATITYRQKHISSIFKKLYAKNLTLDKIYDLIAMRVIVKTIEECYSVLGQVHALYRPVPGRFKDYISSPKPNGYRSLHTTIIVENQHPMEIQIRTEEMHKESEFGAYAHWLYKESKGKKDKLDVRVTWFRQMLEQAKTLSPSEFVDSLKADLYSGIIFVQTPKGKVFEFQEGATAIDFAYAVHSDIGNTCVGAKVNGKIAPISTVLQNGDIVEIITNASSKGPSRDWLNIAKTSSAKSKIRAFFKTELKEDNIKNGRSILEQAVRAKDLSPDVVLSPKYLDEVLERYNMRDAGELYAAVGSGSMSAAAVLGRITPIYAREHAPKEKPAVMNIKQTKDGVLIDGDSGMLVRYAGCCNPIMGDDICGYISRGKGVTIHRKTCPNLKYLEGERLISAQWADGEDKSFTATIKIIADKREGNLVKFTTAITNMKVYISAVEARDIGDNFVCVIAVNVKNKAQLGKIITLLSGQKGVKKVYRSDGWK